MATHTVDVAEIQTTRGEKVLALVLAVFILIGLVWAYDKLDQRSFYSVEPTAAEQDAIDLYNQATQELGLASTERDRALVDLELRRERYRTALDAGQPAVALERQYRAGERALAEAETRVRVAQARVAATQPAADAARERAAREAQDRARGDARVTFFLRLAFVLLVLGASYGLLWALRGSRYLTLALAAVGAAAVLALVLAGDYVEDYVEWRQTGPLALSAAGIALSVAAFWGLQRYLRRKIPLRRLRKGECPFCGFPVGAGSRCEGCGRGVVAPCAQCAEPRRVGVAFCGSCGKA
jgi:hypothetical protein